MPMYELSRSCCSHSRRSAAVSNPPAARKRSRLPVLIGCSRRTISWRISGSALVGPAGSAAPWPSPSWVPRFSTGAARSAASAPVPTATTCTAKVHARTHAARVGVIDQGRPVRVWSGSRRGASGDSLFCGFREGRRRVIRHARPCRSSAKRRGVAPVCRGPSGKGCPRRGHEVHLILSRGSGRAGLHEARFLALAPARRPPQRMSVSDAV